MAVDRDPDSICYSCRDAQVCRFQGVALGPVYHCEEFEWADIRSKKKSDAGDPMLTGPEPHELEDWNDGAGLCSDCLNRKTCVLSNVSGGIWSCEEYREGPR